MKKLITISIIMILGLTACSSIPSQTEPPKGWVGQKILKLEEHSVFSNLPHTITMIPHKNQILVIYTETKFEFINPNGCFYVDNNGIPYKQDKCLTPEVNVSTCVYKFLIHNNEIQNYWIVGPDCPQNCGLQPEGHCL